MDDDTKAVLGTAVLAALGLALLALAVWLLAADISDHMQVPAPVPLPAPTGAPEHSGAPAWAHTCDGTPQERGCPLT